MGCDVPELLILCWDEMGKGLFPLCVQHGLACGSVEPKSCEGRQITFTIPQKYLFIKEINCLLIFGKGGDAF